LWQYVVFAGLNGVYDSVKVGLESSHTAWSAEWREDVIKGFALGAIAGAGKTALATTGPWGWGAIATITYEENLAIKQIARGELSAKDYMDAIIETGVDMVFVGESKLMNHYLPFHENSSRGILFNSANDIRGQIIGHKVSSIFKDYIDKKLTLNSVDWNSAMRIDCVVDTRIINNIDEGIFYSLMSGYSGNVYSNSGSGDSSTAYFGGTCYFGW